MRWLLCSLTSIAVVGCEPALGPASLQLSGNTVVRDDGVQLTILVSAVTARGEPGTGTVAFEATAGKLSDSQLTLVEGAGRVSFSCDVARDARCVGTVTVNGSWNGVAAAQSIHVVPRSTDGGADAGPTDAGRADGGPIDAGRVPGPVDGTPYWWWSLDGGIYWTPPSGDEPPEFSCEYDGGAHPGYTFPDGGPAAVGCDGEPIDAVLLDDPAGTVDVCGTVTLSQPLSDPVYPRGSYNTITLGSGYRACCWRYVCLRNPSQVKYRLRLQVNRFRFGVGARTRNYGTSLFGWYPGTVSAPLGLGDAGWVDLDGSVAVVRNVDFGVGPGVRPGEDGG